MKTEPIINSIYRKLSSLVDFERSLLKKTLWLI